MFFNTRNKIRGKKPLEDSIYTAVARHLKICYPGVLYRFDYGAGIPLGWKAAVRQKELQSGKSFPDLLIFEPVYSKESSATIHPGLALEIKREGTRLKKKNGTWAIEHFQEQSEMLERFKELGWKSQFTIGLKETIETIDNYLKLTNAKKKATIRY